MLSRLFKRKYKTIGHILDSYRCPAIKSEIEKALSAWAITGKEDRPLHQSRNTSMQIKCGQDKVQKVLEDLGGRIAGLDFLPAVDPDSKILKTLPTIFYWGSAVVLTEVWMEGKLTFNIWSFDRSLFERIYNALYELHAPTRSTGNFYVLSMGTTGMTSSWLGEAKEPLIRDNYTQDCLEAFDFLSEQLVSPKPFGRIAILTGIPGSGKTHFIRGLAGCTEARFLLIPANLMGSLTGPSIIGTLDSLSKPYGGGRRTVVVVLEDCDVALVRREQGSLTALAELLNLADGIIGELIDIKIIASTNAKYIELDPAIVRPGRLMRMVEFGTLLPDQATAVLRKLAPEKKDFSFTKPEVLSNIYSVANQGESTTEKPSNTKIRNGDATQSGIYL